jgi:DNA-binding transcriptional MerR regulator
LAEQNQAVGMEERFSQNFNKLYYSIGEVAELLGVNTSLIRFWEKEFTIIKPKKNAKGNRKFTPKDIEILQKIYDLVKVKGFTLEGAKKVLAKKKPSIDFESEFKEYTAASEKSETRRRLLVIREKLLALKR